MEVTFSLNHQKYTSKLNFIAYKIFTFAVKFCLEKIFVNFFFFYSIYLKKNNHLIDHLVTPNQVPIETSLLVFIRSHARLTGTKFMCLEGGCGACIVNISGIRTPSGDSRTIAVNSVRFHIQKFLLFFVEKPK